MSEAQPPTSETRPSKFPTTVEEWVQSFTHLAAMYGGYYQALLHAGFDERAALFLTRDVQRHTLHRQTVAQQAEATAGGNGNSQGQYL